MQEEVEGVLVIRAAGPLDSMNYGAAKDYLDPILAIPRMRVVLDCAKLTYINSRGLTLLARYEKMATFALSFFGIANLGPRIVKAIEMLGMSKLVRVFDTVDTAVAAAKLLALDSTPETTE